MNRSRFAPYAEAAAALGVLAGAGWLLRSGDPLFAGVRPHPAFAVVLLAACRYGALPGLVAGLASCGFLLAGSALAELAVSPVDLLLLAGSGALLGRMRSALVERLEATERELEALRVERDELAAEQATLAEANLGLQRRIAESHASLHTLYRDFLSLEQSPLEQVGRRAVAIVAEQLEASRAALYLRHGGKQRLQAAVGEGYPAKLDTPATIAIPSVALALERRGAVSPFDLPSGAAPDDLFSFVAVLAGADGEALGLLVAGGLPFAATHRAAVWRFSLVAEWVGQLLSRSLEPGGPGGEQLRAGPGLLRPADAFVGRAVSRLGRNPREAASAIVIRLFTEGALPDALEQLLEPLALMLAGPLAPGDVVGRYPAGACVTLLLPGRGRAEREALEKRLMRRLGDGGLPLPSGMPSVGLGLAGVTAEPPVDALQLLSEVAAQREALRPQLGLIRRRGASS